MRAPDNPGALPRPMNQRSTGRIVALALGIALFALLMGLRSGASDTTARMLLAAVAFLVGALTAGYVLRGRPRR